MTVHWGMMISPCKISVLSLVEYFQVEKGHCTKLHKVVY